jgi:hypothetical protein
MKNRGIGFGSFIFLALIISLAAGCNPGFTPDDPSPLVDENGNYIITVNTAGMGERSILPGDAPLYAEEYEIVCRNASGSYFSGYTRGGNLTVGLPEGTYDMLVLAGNGSRILLGTGWLGAQAIGPETGSVTIAVKPLTILESEMSFDDGTANTAPAGTPPTFGPVDAGSSTLTTSFKIHNMDALEAAAIAGGGSDIYTDANGFAAKSVVLKYYDEEHIDTVTSGALSGASGSPNPTLTFNPLGYTAGEDWSALVYLGLEYIPFSQASAPASSRPWHILNGFGRNASNGAVKVTAGTGGSVSVDIFTSF